MFIYLKKQKICIDNKTQIYPTSATAKKLLKKTLINLLILKFVQNKLEDRRTSYLDNFHTKLKTIYIN